MARLDFLAALANALRHLIEFCEELVNRVVRIVDGVLVADVVVCVVGAAADQVPHPLHVAVDERDAHYLAA